ncbi:MAG: radical SAM protein [Bacteroidota bacterium]|nr:radical SAM protein [Bacteroidota bacterium]
MSKKRHKLLLINPLNRRRSGLIRDPKSIYPPMSLGIIAALTPPNWEVEILDENFEKFEYKEADLVGFTALTSSVNRSYELAGIYRKNKVPTVIGGIHVSMLPDEALQYVDTVVKGEAENVWLQLIQDFEKGRIKRLYEARLLPMVESPKPRIDLYHPGYTFGSIQTTRGCPMDCEFCSVHTFNGTAYRPRPVEDVIEEYALIPKEKVYFVDDNLVGYSKRSAERIKEICRGIINSGVKKNWFCSASMNIAKDEELLELMAQAGCRMIFLGIESELIDQLQSVNKNMNLKIGVDNFANIYHSLHKHRIAVLGAFIFGLDSDTTESIRKRTDYMLGAGIDSIQTTILTPLPGTRLYKRFEEEKRLLYTNYPHDWERYSFSEIVYQPKMMEVEEFEEVVQESWERLYNKKSIGKRFIKTLKATNDPETASWAYGSNVQYHNLTFEGHDDEIMDTEFLFK